MSKILSQIWVVILMNITSIGQRIWMSLAAIFAVAVVVAVLLSFLAMTEGFTRTLEGSGSEKVAIVTRSGSQSELNSVLSRDIINIVTTAPGIAQNAGGEAIYSPELYVIVDGIKKSSGTEVNLPMRGISPVGFELRDQVSITSGRMFETGKNEIIVGEGVLREFAGFELGTSVRFGKTEWEVVGTFSTGGNAFESELWADALTVQSQFQRGSSFQTIRVLLESPGGVSGMAEMIENDPRLFLDVVTEADYFAQQGEALNTIVYFGWGVSIFMSVGALAGALNTMYTSVANRAGEIATLRAIGFSNISAFFGTLTESIVLAVIGGFVGAVASYSFMDGLSASTIGASFTQVVFKFELTADLFIDGAVLALVIGLIGGIFPAARAARMPVIVAFRNSA